MRAWISNTVFPSFISASDLFFWHTEHIHNPTKQSNMKCIYRQKKVPYAVRQLHDRGSADWQMWTDTSHAHNLLIHLFYVCDRRN